MKKLAVLFLALFFFSIATPVTAGQVNLADLKKKEEERRKKTDKSKNSLDNTNIREAGKEEGNSSGFMGDDSKPEGITVRDEQKMKQANKAWAKNMEKGEQAVRSQNQAFQSQIKRLEEAIEQDRDYLNRLGTANLNLNHPSNRSNVYSEIQRVEERLKRNQEALKSARENYERFKREARRAGVPAGWLR